LPILIKLSPCVSIQANKMKRALAVILAFFAMGSTASATASLFCTAEDAFVSITIGSVVVSSIVGVDIEIGDILMSTVPDRGEKISLLQSFFTDDMISIDLSDPNLERIVAKIRLFSAYSDDDQAVAGTLLVDGTGAYALVCEGP